MNYSEGRLAAQTYHQVWYYLDQLLHKLLLTLTLDNDKHVCCLRGVI